MVGCGKMGGALLGNWMRGDDTFTVVDPALESVPDGAELVRGTDQLAGRSFDLVVIAVKPQLIDAVMPAYSALLAEGGYALSIAAGCEIVRIKIAMDDATTVRVMHNLPAAIGKGVSAICGSSDASEAHLAHARALMQRTGTVVTVADEDKIDRFTAIAGSGPGYIFEFARSYVEAATDLGFTKDEARAMVLDMIDGTISMARSAQEELADLRNSVTSKGGTTAAGLNALNGEGDLSVLLKSTLDAAYARALELK